MTKLNLKKSNQNDNAGYKKIAYMPHSARPKKPQSGKIQEVRDFSQAVVMCEYRHIKI